MQNLKSFKVFINEAAMAPTKPTGFVRPILNTHPNDNKGYTIANQKYKTDISEKFVSELLRIKPVIMRDFNLSLGDAELLMRIAFGILFRESDAGSSKRYALRQVVGALKVFGAAPSEGLTQVKFSVNFGLDGSKKQAQQNQRLVNKYKLSNDSLATPDGAARATFIILARLYNTAKERHYTGDALRKIVVIAYNVGADKTLKEPKHGKGADTLISQKVPNYIPQLNTDKKVFQKGIPVHISTDGYFNEVNEVGKSIQFK